MASNATTLADEDGDHEDWIELYNSGNEAINLDGYGLSDDYENPFKWIFPSVVIEPGEYLIIWASGKDRNTEEGMVNGIIREVYTDIGGTEISDLTNHPDYPDNPCERHIVTTGFEAPTNIADHYGQRMHGYIKPPETGEYIFWIASDDNGSLNLSTDQNPDNTVEIASVPEWTYSREWDKYPEQESSPIVLEEGNYYYIKALMKEHEGGDNLAVRWQLPDGTIEEPIPDSRLFRHQEELHTNFSISQDGEEVLLTSPDSTLIDEHPPTNIPTDISYGRKPDGTGIWYYFEQPTPGSSNTTQSYTGVLDPPLFSTTGGFYEEEFDLELFHQEDHVTIVYTLDGSEPCIDNLDGTVFEYKNHYAYHPDEPFGELEEQAFISKIFHDYINITDQSGEPNRLANFSSTIHEPYYIPDEPIFKGTIVRARAYKEGKIPSNPTANTYFINPEEPEHVKLPVISVGIQEDHLFGYYDGVYTPGVEADQWRLNNPNSSFSWVYPGNFTRRGVAWEYPGNIEFFDKQHLQQLNQPVGVRIHGGATRSFPVKSLRIYARNKYSNSLLEHPFFNSRPHSAYKRLILRNSGNDFPTNIWAPGHSSRTMFRDAAIQAIVKHMNFTTQAFTPSVLFLNGEYWGIQNIRERYDKHFLGRVFGVDPENIDLLTQRNTVKEGDHIHYNETIDFIETHGLEDDQNYQYIQTRIDTENYIDYQIAQIFSNNTDWPGNNIDFWRNRKEEYEPDAPYGHDGRWRWLMFDMDFGFGLYDNYHMNTIEFATHESGTTWANPPWSTFLFRRFLENEQFTKQFLTRFADQLNTAFLPDRMINIIMDHKDMMAPEIEEHFARWGYPDAYNQWQQHVDVMIDFSNNRPGHQWQHIMDYFNLDGFINVSLSVSDQSQGHIRINSIEIEPGTPGVDESPYPWTGQYYKDIPVELEAIAAPGYEFSHWEGSLNADSTMITISENEDVSLTAHFQKSDDPELIHFWVFDTSLENNTPLEEIDNTYHALNPATIHFQSALDGYPFYPGHPDWRKASMERRNKPTDLNYHPEGNDDIAYEDANMRGLQIREPFSGNAGENTLIFHLPSNGYENLVFKFAAVDEGAADTIIVDYTVNDDWISSGLGTTEFGLEEEYNSVEINFTDIEEVNNNSGFKIRLRFIENGSETDDIARVTFNNISLEGNKLDNIMEPPQIVDTLSLKKTIENGDTITIDLNTIFESPEGETLTYSVSSSRPEFVEANLDDHIVELTPLKRGDAQITISAKDGINPDVEHNFRVLVYPEAFNLDEGNYEFSYWDENNPELTYPNNMLFLQSDTDDPGLRHPLLYPYHIEHDDYHANDSETIGYPYNNTGRSRINGLNGEGISFINTGRERDLGGALLAINTTGKEHVNLKWTAGTILQNDRIYGIQLQYRIGKEGEFNDLIYYNQMSQYVTRDSGHSKVLPTIKLPEALMNQAYVQLLWRYYHIAGDDGPRAQLRLDDISIGTNFASDEALIKSFDFKEDVLEDLVLDNESFIINATVSDLADITELSPIITISDRALIRPRPAVDGDYTPIDFSEPVAFTVISESGLVENTYTVMAENEVTTNEPNIDNITIFPNPANNTINISAEEIIQRVNMIDITGRIIYTHNERNRNISIPVHSFDTGIYFLQIFFKEDVSTRKVQIINQATAK